MTLRPLALLALWLPACGGDDAPRVEGSTDTSTACASLELEDPGFPDHGGVATGSWEL